MKIFGIEPRKAALWLAIIFAAAAILAWLSFLASGGLRTIRDGSEWPSVRVGDDEVVFVDESRTYPIDEVQELEIDVSFARLKIHPVEGDEVTMRYHGSVRTSQSVDSVFTASLADGILTAESRWDGAAIQNADVVLEVGIPAGVPPSIRVDAASGNIAVADLEFEIFVIHLSSGSIEAVGVRADSADLHTSSGSIKARDWTVGSGSITSSSGRLEMESIVAMENLTFRASSGSIFGKNLSAVILEGRAVSGKTDLSGLTGNLRMTGSSGKVTAYFIDPGDSIDIDSASGHIKVGLPSGTAFSLNAHTVSGDVRSDFPVTVTGAMENGRLEGESGIGGSLELMLSASSGDILIEEVS